MEKVNDIYERYELVVRERNELKAKGRRLQRPRATLWMEVEDQ